MRKKLPIGIQTFRTMIEENYVYVDKTKFALDLIENYKYVFLSRPRRFGKSLFLDTLNEIFNGSKELFRGLYIYDKYDFEPYPVIRISWAGDFSSQESTIRIARSIMRDNQQRLEIECVETSPDICFKELIRGAYRKYGRPVVVLIDEYDKPILDNIGDVTEAEKRRTFLRGLYVQIKDNDAYIKFAFITGISKFSKASIFSGLNNLEDISLSPEFATICGYTQMNLQEEFKAYFPAEVDMSEVKEWYNGYNFRGENVYNPFDILLFIRNHYEYRAYWWTSGTPFSLIEFLRKREYNLVQLQNVEISDTALSSSDIEDIQLEALLFQSGYLTIDSVQRKERGIVYKLRVPNKEVQISLNELFAKYLTGKVDTYLQDGVYEALASSDMEKFLQYLRSLFSSIPYTNYVNNRISDYEGYYSSVIYTYLAALGIKIIAEDITERGRIDLTVFVGEKVYILEFKVCDGSCGEGRRAIEQIKERRYYEKYLGRGKEIYLLGIEFDKEQRNIARFDWEKI